VAHAERVRLDGAVRMADVHDAGEGRHAADRAGAQLRRQLRQRRALQVVLQLVDRVAPLRAARAQQVPGEGRVAVLVDGRGYVAVVGAVEGEVPVAPVQREAVREQLQRLPGPAVGCAEGCGDLVRARDGGVLETCRGSSGLPVVLAFRTGA
jgi:hypothetical protein